MWNRPVPMWPLNDGIVGTYIAAQPCIASRYILFQVSLVQINAYKPENFSR